MNVNGLSNLTNPYIQSLLNSSLTGTAGNTGGINSSTLNLPQEPNPQLSPLANILNTLQQLVETNPTQYQQVTGQIATNLQNAANSASSGGNTTLANQLNQLASDFTNASQNKALPNINDLAQAVGSAHGRHHHQHGAAPVSDASSTNSSSNSSNNSSGSTNSSPGGLSQLFSSLFGSSASSSQGTSLDALSIINNTLSNAGLQ